MSKYLAIAFVVLTMFVTVASKAAMVSDAGKFLSKLYSSDEEVAAPITWYGFEEAIDKMSEEKKFIFIDIYTDWCSWCKKMDLSTFLDSGVVEYMNENFYAVKMNAETKEGIAYKEILYEYKSYGSKGYNELAYSMLGGQMSFPSFVVLSKKEVKLGTIVGFKQPTELVRILKGYVEK